MVKDEKSVLNVAIEPENKELVNQLALEIMEPALQKAIKEAREKATPIEIMSALANAYGGFLVEMLLLKVSRMLPWWLEVRILLLLLVVSPIPVA